ncbi:hypothetical protein ACMYYO_01355 [Dermacoccaceae bacterium W4C1]
MIDLIAEIFCVAGFAVSLFLVPAWLMGLLRGPKSTILNPSDRDDVHDTVDAAH